MNRKRENDLIRELVLVAVAKEEKVGGFQLSGRGHEPRVTLNRSLAGILRGLDIPRVTISGYGANNYYPRRVFGRRCPFDCSPPNYSLLRSQIYEE